MTKLFVTGQFDFSTGFGVIAAWSAALMLAAVFMREYFDKRRTMAEIAAIWSSRILGIIGASAIFVYAGKTSDELKRVEQQCERWKAIASAQANGVSKPMQGPQYTTVSITGADGTEIQVRNIEHDYESARSLLGAKERTCIDGHGYCTDFAADGSGWCPVDSKSAVARGTAGGVGCLPVGASSNGTTGAGSVY